MGLLDLFTGGADPQQPQPAGLLGPDLARITNAYPIPTMDQYARDHWAERNLGGFRKGLLSGIIGAVDNDAPAQYAQFLAGLQGLTKTNTDNQMGALDLLNVQQRAAAAGVPMGRPVGAQIGTAMTPGMQGPGSPPMMPPDAGQSGAVAGAPQAGGAAGNAMGGFALSPMTMMNLINQSWGPTASKNIPALISAAETMMKNGTGITNGGAVDVLPGQEQANARTSFAGKYGETVAGNNKNTEVGPGARVIFGPTSLTGQSLPGRPVGGVYNNPNPTQQNIINMPGAAPFFQGLGDKLGQEAFGVLQGGDTAAKQLQIAQAQRDLLQLHRQAGGSQGYTEPMKVQTAAILQGLGFDPSALGLPRDAGPAQALEALSKKQALGNIGGEGGLPANNFSEADRKFVQSMQSSLGDTEAGWEAKTMIGERLAQRSIEAQKSLSPVIFQGPPEQAPNRYLQWKAAQNANNAMRPLFTPEDKAKLAELAKIDQTQRKANPAPAAPAAPAVSVGTTATGPNGAKVRWNGNAWEPVQ